MNVSIISIIVYVSTFSVLAPLIMGLYTGDWTNRFSNLLITLCVVSLLSDLISLIFTHFRINNWPVGNLFLLIQFIILFIVGDNRKNNLLTATFFICVAFGVLDFLVLQTPIVFNSFSAYANGILMIIFSLSFLYRVMVEMPVERVQSLPLFWLSFGVLVYYGGNTFLFLFNNYLIERLPRSHRVIWMLHNVLNISKNLFLFLTLWANYKNRTYQR